MSCALLSHCTTDAHVVGRTPFTLLLSWLCCLLQFSIRQGLIGLAVLLGDAETRETVLPSPQLDISQQPEQTGFLADICKWVARAKLPVLPQALSHQDVPG